MARRSAHGAGHDLRGFAHRRDRAFLHHLREREPPTHHKHSEHQREHAGIPEREAQQNGNANGFMCRQAGGMSVRMYPAPRRVWMSGA